MSHHIRTLLSILFFIIVLSSITFSAETRGLSVVANDPASGKQGEVRLYNKSYAVIIGIDRYQNLSADRQLQNAVKDANGVEKVLRKSYQFDKIITLQNEKATKDRIMEVLTEELPAQLGNDDALFIFWAGHGSQEKSYYGEMIGFLIPYDGSADKLRKNITMAEIRDTVSKKIPAKHIFYVMDACYSGLLTTRTVDGKTRRDLNYLKEITKESARQVLTAGGKGEEALDGGPKGHSVFTGRLIEILENAPDFITANELQASIKEKVHSDARARNHTQTPGFGALYGLGDFVFIPKQQDRLGDLTGTSASRQKELEQLRKTEEEASAAKKREQTAIARKEKELAVLDKQIAEMKGRLGTSAAHSDDSLDQIIALVEQKEEQGKRLEVLRQVREAEERKRQQEIKHLRQEALEKKAELVKIDLAKYEKVASSKYAGDLKKTAWKAMVTNYPEANNVKVGDIDRFLSALGLTRHDIELVPTEKVKAKPKELQKKAVKEKVLVKIDSFEAFAASDPSTDEQKTLYAIGVTIGRQLEFFNFIADEFVFVQQGIRDKVNGKKIMADPEDYKQQITELSQHRVKISADKEKAKSEEFLANSTKEKGAQKTYSGLIYIPITVGTGKQPRNTDVVKVHYTGTLVDGKEFDSSIKRGQPIEFPLSQVIKCWSEGVSKMKVGGKAKLVCPSTIAYGDEGRPPIIPGGATLVFEVALLDTKAGSTAGEEKADSKAYLGKAVLKNETLKTGTAPQQSEVEKQNTLYAIGVTIGRQLEFFAFTADELDYVQQGIADKASGKKVIAEPETYGRQISELAQARMKTSAEKEKAKSKDYIENAAKEKGAVKTDSGLIYVPITAGTGKQPKTTDVVKVHYTGTLVDGKEFDSSIKRGQPIEFPLNQVIKCWSEGVSKMKVGGKAKLVCPSTIAYGDEGRPPVIPGGATLIFEVELLDTKAPAAGAAKPTGKKK